MIILMHMKLKLGLVAVILVAAVVGLILGLNNSDKSGSKSSSDKPVSSSIPVGSTLAVAKAHSKGTLPTCLAKDATAEAAVKNDDKLIDGSYPAFDLAATSGIIDVPAGTNVDENIHSYDGKTVTGSLAYPAKYGNYNFKIVPSSKAKPYSQWKMTYLTACKS